MINVANHEVPNETPGGGGSGKKGIIGDRFTKGIHWGQR